MNQSDIKPGTKCTYRYQYATHEAPMILQGLHLMCCDLSGSEVTVVHCSNGTYTVRNNRGQRFTAYRQELNPHGEQS